MTTIELIRELSITENAQTGKGIPTVTVIYRENGEEAFRRDAGLLSTDDINAISSEIVKISALSVADVDQAIASQLQPLRIAFLRKRDEADQGAEPSEPSERPEGQPVPESQRYVAVIPMSDDERDVGFWEDDRQLTNFVVRFEADSKIEDDIEPQREFCGTLFIGEESVPFSISPTDFAYDQKLRAAIYEQGGSSVVFRCSMEELRRVITLTSKQAGTIRKARVTTNFGWTSNKPADESTDELVYLSPSVKISKAGVELLDDDSELRVNLDGQRLASNLDLKILEPEEIQRVKRHICKDLLLVNDQSVTYPLLASVATAIVYRCVEGAGRCALWLVGCTGAGKSFVAQLFSNFFGNFPLGTTPFTSWSATPNFIQQHGYFYRDALYLVDDYKPEVIAQTQAVRILQAYADNTGRGRLKSDATANYTRPIRGQLICTGEDVPEHQASTTARSIILSVPQNEKRLDEGVRCVKECRNYSGITADFIRWLLVENRIPSFRARFEFLRERFNRKFSGRNNDIRIATNLAMLGASFELIAEYFKDVWPDWQQESEWFVDDFLLARGTAMLDETRDQQASEVFLRILSDLILGDYVRVDGLQEQEDVRNKPLVGRIIVIPSRLSMDGGQLGDGRLVQIRTSLALEEVNKFLRDGGKPPLRCTDKALLSQLREDGKLVDPEGNVLDSSADATRRVQLDGGTYRVFTMRWQDLRGV